MIEPKFTNHLASAGKASGTIRAYTDHLTMLERVHGDLLTLTTEDLEGYIGARALTHKPESRKSMRTAFRSYYRWAYRTGRIQHNPAIDLDPITIPLSVVRVATDEQVLAGLESSDTQVRAMIMLARYGCLRLSELSTLHTSARHGDLLRIRGKGSKERIVPLNDELLEALLVLEREQGDGYYFPGRFGSHMHPQSVHKKIKQVVGINPHALRHAGATAAYLATGDLEALRLFLGHSSIATTQRYLHVGLTQIRSIANATAIVTPITAPPTSLAA